MCDAIDGDRREEKRKRRVCARSLRDIQRLVVSI